METQAFDTDSADDVVRVGSHIEFGEPKVRLSLDTGDAKVSTILTADQARAVASALLTAIERAKI